MPSESTRTTGCDRSHPLAVGRRAAIQAGAVSLLGLGTNHLNALRAAQPDGESRPPRACIYIFLSGGLAQHESFDLKPNAPDTIRGEFVPIATRTPGVQICEHLPLLAARSNLWSLCRSLTHSSNEHSAGHLLMLTGRSQLPPTFNASKPQPEDWPCIASVAGAVTQPRHNLPPAVVLPERLVHNSGRVIPGQFAGHMGEQRDPWFIEASPFHSKSYGAFPEYSFDHQTRGSADDRVFQAPSLTLAQGLTRAAFTKRLDLLSSLERQQVAMDEAAHVIDFDRDRQGAISLLSDSAMREAFDVTHADDAGRRRGN